MERWVKRLLSEERKKRGIPLEVKHLGRNYYLYHSTTVWDRAEGKRRKVSRYVGRVTREGLIEARERWLEARTIHEFGNAKLAWNVIEEVMPALRASFPDDHEEIAAMALVRAIQQTPIRLVKSRWEKLYLSQDLNPSLSPNVISDKLRSIGADYASQADFFSSLMKKSKYLIFDLSSIFSYSENLNLAEKGQNAEHLYVRQVNFAMIFSHDEKIPVMIKPMPGSVRDIKSFKSVLQEYDMKSCIMVMDRGMASYALPSLIKERELRFVFPLRRNMKKIVDYAMRLDKSFPYRDRGVNCGKRRVRKEEGLFLYMYEDTKLRYEEETTFISLIRDGQRKQADLEVERPKFGKISLLSSIDDDPERVYLLWKNREEVEEAFDAMKNELENDKAYLSNDDAIRGYFFTSFLSLYIYYRLLEMLRRNGLTGKVSVNELLFELSKVYLISYHDGKKRLSDIPAKPERLEKSLGLELFPKNLRS